ncbi:hypothetical protein J3R83DRAFT_116 [Lanmaoa asiatica]|nr:hypothetical protein J3R83DRAFT_116 [Lanmaoa asiatica]
MSHATVKLIWKCTKPNSQAVVHLCESLMTKAAEQHVHGKYVRTTPHITGDIVNTKVNKGYALHWNLDASRTAALPSHPPKAPNPETWELKYQAGKGFILVDDPETVHDI